MCVVSMCVYSIWCAWYVMCVVCIMCCVWCWGDVCMCVVCGGRGVDRYMYVDMFICVVLGCGSGWSRGMDVYRV